MKIKEVSFYAYNRQYTFMHFIEFSWIIEPYKVGEEEKELFNWSNFWEEKQIFNLVMNIIYFRKINIKVQVNSVAIRLGPVCWKKQWIPSQGTWVLPLILPHVPQVHWNEWLHSVGSVVLLWNGNSTILCLRAGRLTKILCMRVPCQRVLKNHFTVTSYWWKRIWPVSLHLVFVVFVQVLQV